MPSANAFLQPLDNPQQPVAPPDDDDPWGFNAPLSANEPVGVNKKKKKAKKKSVKNAAPAPPESDSASPRIDGIPGDESPAYLSSVATSPPKDQGVKLRPRGEIQAAALLDISPPACEPLAHDEDSEQPPPSPPSPPSHPSSPSPPLPPLSAAQLSNEHTVPVSQSQPSPRPAPAASPSTRSPRPFYAEPASKQPATSPMIRPAILRDRQSSISSGYNRPSVMAKVSSAPRRESFAANASAVPLPRFVDPPPPHLPQAHFFTLPDFGLNLTRKQEAGKPPGSDGYCCSLDSFADAGNDVSARKAKDALLVGSEGGLDVYRILPNKLEVVGRIEGLRGAVIRAKIIPCTDRSDRLQPLRPLIAVVVHGLAQGNDGGNRSGADDVDPVNPHQHQTTVELYSLQTQTHLATLYKSVLVTAEQPAYNQVSSLPGPVGDLRLAANGRYIVVASAQSGEVLVFTDAPISDAEDVQYRCVGKFWTSLQSFSVASPSRSSTTASAATEAGPQSTDTPEMHYEPIFSLGQRWLTIVPPMLSATISVAGVPLLSDVNPSPPGLATHVAPTQPPLVSCEVSGTDVEGAWIRLGRQAAQGLVKYSQKGIQMGLQGWKELTQPAPPGPARHARATSREELFPPTKGPSDDPSRHAKEPALVSVVDLETLLQWEEYKPKHPLAPMATFALVDGCSFVSLSSTGTKLLTTSRKGEASFVWDLAQAAHGSSVPRTQPQEEESANGPCVRQLHRIARSTPSTVLDCAWSRDDEALALLTAHGTVHLHEIPKHPLPKRRKRRSTASSAPAPEKADATTSLSMGLSPPSSNQGFLGSIKSSWQNVSTQVNSMRSANPASALGLPTTFAGFREATAAAGNAGSRAVARGLSQGYTAAKGGASDYWHAEDNKIRHKALQDIESAKSIRWIKRHTQTSLVISCGGTVHIHPIQRVERRKGDDIVSGLKSERYARKGFPLPPITTRSESEQVRAADVCAEQGPHGFWSFGQQTTPPVPSNARYQGGQSSRAAMWTQHNDVETNPPYCPFHIDAHIDIFAIDEYNQTSRYESSGGDRALADFQMQGYGVPDEEPWTFGAPLPPSTKMNEKDVQDFSHDLAAHHSRRGTKSAGNDRRNDISDGAYSDADDDDGLADQMESRLTIQASRHHSGPEQIRINTRRRIGKQPSDSFRHAEEFGEFNLMDDEEALI